MNRPILICALFAAAAAALGAQSVSQSSPYEGTSTPPADDTITTTVTVQAKPPAGQRSYVQPIASAPVQAHTAPQPTLIDPAWNYPDPAADYPTTQQREPALSARVYAADPDGDIVHPRPLRRGELADGTTIRVRLMQRLSTATSEKGEFFRSRVVSDVLQGSDVTIPAGSEIDGRVVQVSTGHLGGHGSMRLQPETVILPNGSRYRLYAEVTGTPGSKTRVGSEGAINPGSRVKRDSIEYTGAVGGGAITGAVLGGPVGALTGSLIGASVITAHLLVNHPQATLETGTVVLFTLTEQLNLTPADEGGN
jgi:hypothetical protein